MHSSIGYITPKDKSEGKEKDIKELRHRKLKAARENRVLQLMEDAKFLFDITLDKEFNFVVA